MKWPEGISRIRTNDDGAWVFDRRQSELWDEHSSLIDKHNKLVRQWNKFVGDYNREVAPREIGRPLEASDAQVKTVLKLRKTGVSLRGIRSSDLCNFAGPPVNITRSTCHF